MIWHFQRQLTACTRPLAGDSPRRDELCMLFGGFQLQDNNSIHFVG
jgi:hypothetical protein